MATPLREQEANATFDTPHGMPDVEPLDAVLAWDEEKRPHIVSRWQFSKDELDTLMRNGGKFYLGLISTHQPPVYIAVDRPYLFEDELTEDERNGIEKDRPGNV